MKPVHCQNTASRVGVLNARTGAVSLPQQQGAWKMWVTGLGLMSAFAVTILAAGLSVDASYELAQLQARRQAAVQQEQVLSESLAQAQSLQVVQAYAAEHGFAESASYQAALPVHVSVAQR